MKNGYYDSEYTQEFILSEFGQSFPEKKLVSTKIKFYLIKFFYLQFIDFYDQSVNYFYFSPQPLLLISSVLTSHSITVLFLVFKKVILYFFLVLSFYDLTFLVFFISITVSLHQIHNFDTFLQCFLSLKSGQPTLVNESISDIKVLIITMSKQYNFQSVPKFPKIQLCFRPPTICCIIGVTEFPADSCLFTKCLKYKIQFQKKFIFQMKESESWRYPNIAPPDRQKKMYSRGPSLLDEQNPDSKLNKSNFRGFFNMAAIFAFVFLFTSPVISKIENDYFFEPYLYHTFKQDYFLCVMVWPLFFLWSFTSYFLQKLILWGISKNLVLFLQHLTQTGLFIFSSVLILTKNWCSTHCAFVILQACAHFMKMHSYTTVNRDYREQMLRASKNGQKILSKYPDNINIKDFILFMWTPWLVYDEYPRKATLSLAYIVKKSIITLICISMAYLIHTNYILCYIELGQKIHWLQLLFIVMLPATLIIIIMFYITFENITNIFAQITKLDYRQFYEDWWNSTTYEEFNRKWNKPVHIFLYRHLYLEMIVRYKFTKGRAQLLTFLFSAALHEYLLAMIFRIIRPFFLFFIIGQVPLIYLTKFMVGKKSGNYLYWFGIIIGPSIIINLYLRSSQDVTMLFTRTDQYDLL